MGFAACTATVKQFSNATTPTASDPPANGKKKQNARRATKPIFMFGKQHSMHPVIHVSHLRHLSPYHPEPQIVCVCARCVQSHVVVCFVGCFAACTMDPHRYTYIYIFARILFVYLTKWFKCLHCASQLNSISMARRRHNARQTLCSQIDKRLLCSKQSVYPSICSTL